MSARPMADRMPLSHLATLRAWEDRRVALSQVALQSDAGGFRVQLADGKWHTMPGLTEDLRAQYFAHYRPPRPPPRPAADAAPRRGAKGWARGRRVHEGLERYVDAMDAASFILANQGALPTDLADQRRMFEYMAPRLHPMVKSLARAFEAWHWIPLYSEFLVFDTASLARATSIDLIVYDAARLRFTFIELKTGYRGIFTRPGTLRLDETPVAAAARRQRQQRGAARPHLSAELEGSLARHRIANSPLHQAFLQLIASTYMFSTLFGDILSQGALYVVHVEDDNVPPRRWSISQPLYRAMSDALIQNRRLFEPAPERA